MRRHGCVGSSQRSQRVAQPAHSLLLRTDLRKKREREKERHPIGCALTPLLFATHRRTQVCSASSSTPIVAFPSTPSLSLRCTKESVATTALLVRKQSSFFLQRFKSLMCSSSPFLVQTDVYSITDNGYQDMLQERADQSILITYVVFRTRAKALMLHLLQRRIRCRQDGEHQESHPVLCGCGTHQEGKEVSREQYQISFTPTFSQHREADSSKQVATSKTRLSRRIPSWKRLEMPRPFVTTTRLVS